MRVGGGDERESASLTAARQLAQEARDSWRVPRPPARVRPAVRAITARTPEVSESGDEQQSGG